MVILLYDSSAFVSCSICIMSSARRLTLDGSVSLSFRSIGRSKEASSRYSWYSSCSSSPLWDSDSVSYSNPPAYHSRYSHILHHLYPEPLWSLRLILYFSSPVNLEHIQYRNILRLQMPQVYVISGVGVLFHIEEENEESECFKRFEEIERSDFVPVYPRLIVHGETMGD